MLTNLAATYLHVIAHLQRLLSTVATYPGNIKQLFFYKIVFVVSRMGNMYKNKMFYI